MKSTKPRIPALLLAFLSCTPSLWAALPGVNGKIAFFRRTPSTLHQIWTMNSDGSGQANLSNNSFADFSPSYSPDGARIAFMRGLGLTVSEIWVMNADGSGQVQLTSNTFSDSGPVWSPDGSRIAFTSDRDGNSEIYSMASDGSDVIRLTNNAASDFDPTWSPDGGRIAFTRNLSDQEVFVLDLASLTETNVTNDPANDRAADWSPDGTEIAFVSDRDGDLEIYVMNDDGSAVVQLTDNTVLDNVPAWSSDGNWIAFASNQAPILNIYRIAADGSGSIEQLTSNEINDQPTWQPLTPQAAIGDLRLDVQSLVSSGALGPGRGVNLTIRLTLAQISLDLGNVQLAIFWLQSFVNQVEAYIANGILTPVEGQPLVDQAQAILDFLLG
jgi:TolB protein